MGQVKMGRAGPTRPIDDPYAQPFLNSKRQASSPSQDQTIQKGHTHDSKPPFYHYSLPNALIVIV